MRKRGSIESILTVIVGIVVFAWPTSAMAADRLDIPRIVGILGNIYTTIIVGVGGVAAIIFLIIGGFMYIISGGDKMKLETAKSTITLAIVGLFVILCSYLIIDNIICQELLKMPDGCL